MTEPTNPVHVTVDCGSGDITVVEMTDAEVAAMAKADKAHNEAMAAKIVARAQAIETIKASKDPAMQALVQILGIQ